MLITAYGEQYYVSNDGIEQIELDGFECIPMDVWDKLQFYSYDKETKEFIFDVESYNVYAKEIEINDKIQELKNNLSNTDYVSIKIAEGAATKEEYANILLQRAEWREQINELEGQLK